MSEEFTIKLKKLLVLLIAFFICMNFNKLVYSATVNETDCLGLALIISLSEPIDVAIAKIKMVRKLLKV